MAPITQFMMDNPGLRFAQLGLILFAAFVLFLLFFALRDILLRTRSFWYQFFCIVIVTLFPVVGFLIYLLIRPARTIKQRELEAMLLTIVATDAPGQIAVGIPAVSVPAEDKGRDDEEKKQDDEDDDDDEDEEDEEDDEDDEDDEEEEKDDSHDIVSHKNL